MANLLVFSPYAKRSFIDAYEGTIAKACQVRGANVQYLLCDGLLPECDMYWNSWYDGKYARQADLCETCMAGSRQNLEKLNIPHTWLGKFVGADEKLQAFSWAQSVLPHDMRTAVYQGDPIGEWVLSTMISYFRQYPPDMTNWRVATVYRGFLYGAVIVATGIRNYLDKHQVDSALLFNGRQSITRVALDIFRQRKIPVAVHELPYYQRNHVSVKSNAQCLSNVTFAAFWKDWQKVPLTRESLEKTLRWLKNRRSGTGLSWYAFNSPYVRDVSIRNTLHLDPGKRMMALFTSSTDETASDPEYRGPYETQEAWVLEVIRWVANRTDVELVVRVHPHLAGKTGLGRAHDEYNCYLKIKANLPQNVRMIMPDDALNSYGLMEEADIGIVSGSSVAVEMGMLGKPIVLGSRGYYEDADFVLRLHSKEATPALLEKSLGVFDSREIRRTAFRMAYYYAFEFELPFPLVTMTGVLDSKLNYSSETELMPNHDRVLDQICNFLLDGTPLFPAPSPAELSRSQDDENAFFDWLEHSADPLRDPFWILWPRRVAGLGRSIRRSTGRLRSKLWHKRPGHQRESSAR